MSGTRTGTRDFRVARTFVRAVFGEPARDFILVRTGRRLGCRVHRQADRGNAPRRRSDRYLAPIGQFERAAADWLGSSQ